MEKQNIGTKRVLLKKHENVLFLDFDGVCNSFETGSYMTHPPGEYGVDPKIMERIRRLCKTANAKVVVSSNWRKFDPRGSYQFNENRYKNPLGKLYDSIGDLIVGTLPPERHVNKSEALFLWFEDHPEFDGKYAIVDDDPREGFQNNAIFRKNLWMTDAKYGLTDKIAGEIAKHLRD